MTRVTSGEELVRLFGAANIMAMSDLQAVEAKYDVHVLTRKTADTRKDNGYFLQFDEEIRKEATQMARSYEVFYCLEKSIRTLVKSRLEEPNPKDWWEQTVPQSVRDEVRKRMQTEVDSGMTQRSEEPLDYTTFGELGQIIASNWTLFGDTFSSRKAVEKVMTSLNNLRGPIAHCSPLAADEIVRLDLTVRDWFRLME